MIVYLLRHSSGIDDCRGKFRYEVANQYFLLICILQSIPSVSITDGIPTTAIPLALVLFVDGFFTAVQDYNRHVADRSVNLHSKVELIRNGKKLDNVSWRDIRVGDIVKVRRENRFPCDMLCLGAVHGGLHEVGTKHRRCHVNTKDLDGENNLKMRKAVQSTSDKLVIQDGIDADEQPHWVARRSEEENDKVWCNLSCYVDCDAPNGDLDRFSGKVYTDDSSEGEFVESDNLLLRTTELRNCSYVYGLAAYTGYDTKINYGGGGTTAEKAASLSGNIDYFVIGMFSLLFVLCLIGASLNLVWESDNSDPFWFLQLSTPTALEFVEKFFTFFLLLSQMVPISLYVSIKITRQAQKFMMDRDTEMALLPKNTTWIPTTAMDHLCCCKGDRRRNKAHESQNVINPLADVNDIENSGALKGGGKPPQRIIRGDDPSVMATEVRTMDLNDELGQITHIFSDKTGTLTCNDFQFRQMSIGGKVYGQATTQIGVITARANAKSEKELKRVRELEELLHNADNTEFPLPKVKFYESPDASPTFQEAKSLRERAEEIKYFMYNLALDHTVEIEPSENSVKYSSASPDEESFAYTAKYFGYEFLGDDADIRKLRVTDPSTGQKETKKFRMLALLPFTSARGMMSAIVEDLNVPSDHPRRFVLYSKGADNAIGEKLYPVPSGDKREQELRASTEKNIKDFGADGLRAMAFAMKPLDENTVELWLDDWSEARSIHDEAHKKAEMQACMAAIEKDMQLQGATAIEDRLQDEVAETIATLSQANIKIYMLTGDKEETAINIGYGVNMLTSSHARHVITLGQFQREGLVPEEIGDLYNYSGDPQAKDLDQRLSGPQLVEKRIFELRLKLVEDVPEKPQALVVDKDVLQILLDYPEMNDDLVFVAEKCASVICCRCRPKQKQAMLMLIKTHVKGSKCLAIGDGANDVDMINVANVGVGILGAEGSGAANSSDYKIPQFKVLKRLLLVHGRWNYIRMATLIAYMFYKNALFTLVQYWYSNSTGWSGQKFFIEMATQSFNLIYTGAPILVVAVLDQDIDSENAQRFPRLYSTSQSGFLTPKTFSLWIVSAIYESLIAYFVTEKAFFVPDPDGSTPSVFELGTVVFTAVVLLVSVRLAAHTSFHYWPFQLVLVFVVICWPITAFIFGALDADRSRGSMPRLFGSAAFWVSQLFLLVCAILPVGILMAVRTMFYPSYQQKVKETQLFIQPRYSSSEFSSVLPCQFKINDCVENADRHDWETKKGQLLLSGLELDAREHVEKIQTQIYSFNALKQSLINNRVLKNAHLKCFEKAKPLDQGVAPLSDSRKKQLLQRIVETNRQILVQFGKLDGKSSTFVPVKGQSTDREDKDEDDMPKKRRNRKSALPFTTPGNKVHFHPDRMLKTDFDHDVSTSEESSSLFNRLRGQRKLKSRKQ